jgi:hypothetical protein
LIHRRRANAGDKLCSNLESSTYLIEKYRLKGDRTMGLLVSAQVIRELIADGDYLVECIEQRERGKVAVALALRSRMQPYSIEIETVDSKLTGLFRALLDGKSSHAEKSAVVKLGSQPVPVVEVESLPADAPTSRRRRKHSVNSAGVQAGEPSRPARQARSSAGQLILVPQEGANESAPPPSPPKRKRAARVNDRNATQ